jgi:hypothetical protein
VVVQVVITQVHNHNLENQAAQEEAGVLQVVTNQEEQVHKVLQAVVQVTETMVVMVIQVGLEEVAAVPAEVVKTLQMVAEVVTAVVAVQTQFQVLQ